MADPDADASLQSDGARLEAAVSLLRNCNSTNKGGEARKTVSVKLSDPQSLLLLLLLLLLRKKRPSSLFLSSFLVVRVV